MADGGGGGIYLGDPQYKIDEWVGEIVGRRGVAFEALRDEFQALITGFCDQVAMRMRHDPGFDPRRITFERPRWLNDGGRFMFDVSYDGRALLPSNHRWE